MVSFKSVVISGISYFIHPHKLGSITATINPDSIIPVTLLSTEEIFGDRLEQILTDFDTRDDVFTPDFGGVLVEKVPANGTEYTNGFDRSSMSQQVYSMMTSEPDITNELNDLPSGPYILQGPNLYQAWRMYPDSSGAFITGVYPDNVTHVDLYQSLPFTGTPFSENAIAVPSRLYSAVTTEKPLAGLRISVSDAFDLKGIQTTMSSRDYVSTFPPSTTTAKYVKSLIDLGANIVGKTKIQPLGSGTQWHDLSEPFSPRGDGYQSTFGSSPGAAVAMASYDWLDNSVCEDAISGLRVSAAHAGVYALRPTHSSAALDGLTAHGEAFSTITVAARKLQDLERAGRDVEDPFCDALEPVLLTKKKRDAKRLAHALIHSVQLPRKRLVVIQDFWEGVADDERFKFRNFISRIEQALEIESEEMWLSEVWEDHPPQQAQGATLDRYMESPVNDIFGRGYYNATSPLLDQFRNPHRDQPLMEKITRQLLRNGETVTSAEYERATEHTKVFADWFEENVFQGLPGTLVLFAQIPADPQPRTDTHPHAPELMGVSSQNLAPLLGAPQLIIPFNQIKKENPFNYTVRDVWRPLSVAILGRRCSDSAMVKTMQETLEKAGWATEVSTGTLAFEREDRRQSSEPERQVEL